MNGAPRNDWPIVIGGCHRSGTSLVRRILNAHSRIHCGPEVKFFRDLYGDYFDDPLRHLRFITSARSLLPESDLLNLLGKSFVALHERAAAIAGKPRWADKNPENVLYGDQWQQLLGDRWLFILVLRNPLDTLSSIQEVGFPLTIPKDLSARIGHYCRYVAAGLDFSTKYPERCYKLIYERFVESPEIALRSLMAWLGERVEPAQLTFNDGFHQSGLEDPKIANASEIHATSVGRWSSVLSKDEARLIWMRTRHLWTVIDSSWKAVVEAASFPDL